MSVPSQLKPFLNQLLAAFGEHEASATMRLLVEDMLGLNWNSIRMGFSGLEEDKVRVLEKATTRILAGEPPQYVTGKAWFYGRDFIVDKRVLIPRRETEELVEWVLKEMGKNAWKGLDIGTGSGCIPITIACENPFAQLHAIDVSGEALEVASLNANRMRADIEFREMDILNPPQNAFNDLDVIISNPPYVPAKELSEMAPRVRDHEPSLALFVPNDDPLRFYKAIATVSKEWLKPEGKLFYEIHEDYGSETVAMLKDEGFCEISLRNDMQGKPRMVMASV